VASVPSKTRARQLRTRRVDRLVELCDTDALAIDELWRAAQPGDPEQIRSLAGVRS